MSSTRKSFLSQITQILVVGYTLRSYTVYEGQGPNGFRARHTNFGHELTRWMNQAAIRRGERMLSRDPVIRERGSMLHRMLPQRLISDHCGGVVKRGGGGVEPAPQLKVQAKSMATK